MRPEETLYKTLAHLDPYPEIEHKQSRQHRGYQVYWWSATQDPLPFWLGITNTELSQAIHIPHKLPNGGYALQQYYRNILENTFVCTILSPPITAQHAQRLRNYIYTEYKKHYETVFFTQKPPTLDSHLLPIIPKTPLTIPTQPPTSQGFRAAMQEILRNKLIKKAQNREYNERLKQRRKEELAKRMGK